MTASSVFSSIQCIFLSFHLFVLVRNFDIEAILVATEFVCHLSLALLACSSFALIVATILIFAPYNSTCLLLSKFIRGHSIVSVFCNNVYYLENMQPSLI